MSPASSRRHTLPFWRVLLACASVTEPDVPAKRSTGLSPPEEGELPEVETGLEAVAGSCLSSTPGGLPFRAS